LREQEAIDSLARDEWEIFKQKVRAECAHMASVTPMDFEYAETRDSLGVSRFEGGVALRILNLRYDPAVPRIVWQCLNPREKKGWITFRLFGSGLLYVADNANVQVPELIRHLTMCLTGQL
jgi:hypothetical protein